MTDNNLKWSLISVKGIAVANGAIALARNARDEWDLPGGKLELGEALADCLAREFLEELGIEVAWGRVVDVVHHHFHENIVVVIVGCASVSQDALQLSGEHSEVRWIPLSELNALNLVPHYRKAIDLWVQSQSR